MSFSLLICRRCSSAPFCLLHCCVSDVSPRGRGFDSALPRLLQKVCHNSSSSSCFVCLNVYTYTRMSILQSFPSESRGGEGRMLSERKMKWKMCRFGHNWSVFTFHNHKHALNLKHWTKKNTWMKCVQAWKAYLTFLPVFSPLRKAQRSSYKVLRDQDGFSALDLFSSKKRSIQLYSQSSSPGGHMT